jgi:transcriptional regulator with XRE-family HTH domain
VEDGAGDRLKAARVEAGYAEASDFAKRVHINPTTYRAYENGQNGYAKHAAVFAQKLGTSVEWLLYGQNPPRSASGGEIDLDMVADFQAVTEALLLKLGRKPGEAEVLASVARRAVEALQGRPGGAAERALRAQTAVDVLWTGSRH